MKFSKLFTVSNLSEDEEDMGGWGVKVEPTKRLRNLHPHKAIAELQQYVDGVKELIAYYHETFEEKDFERPESLAKMKKAAFELDVTESYLTYLRKHYQTIH